MMFSCKTNYPVQKTQFNKYQRDFHPFSTSQVKMFIAMQDTTKLYFEPEPEKSNKILR